MRYTLEAGGQTHEVEVTRLGPDRFQYKIGNAAPKIVDADLADGLVHLLTGDQSHTVRLGARGDATHAHVGGHIAVVEVQDERKRRAAQGQAGATEGRKVIRSPMPGKIVKVLVAVGDTVAAGQGVVIVEAMKMENELRSPGPGVVKEIKVQAGGTVEGNAELVIIEGAGG